MERRREARPRPEVQEEERPLHAASRPIGGKNGKKTFEDGERDSRIADSAPRRRPQIRDQLGKTSPSLIDADPYRGAGYVGEAPRMGDGMITHRPASFRRERSPRARRVRRRKKKSPRMFPSSTMAMAWHRPQYENLLQVLQGSRSRLRIERTFWSQGEPSQISRNVCSRRFPCPRGASPRPPGHAGCRARRPLLRPGAALRRPLHGGRGGRLRRDGAGLQGDRPEARQDGRVEAHPARHRRATGGPGAVPARAGARAGGHASQRVPRPRPGRGGRRRLHQHGVRRGAEPGGPDPVGRPPLARSRP